jgi:DNA-binding PadR family transcriptional regulator
MLGMLRLGVRSGYAIKKATDISARFFWPTSFSQVYPELTELEQNGLVTRRDDSRGARPRSAYEVTEEGETALIEWLRSPVTTPLKFRDEGVLRLYFADELSREEQLRLVWRMRERARASEHELREEILPLADPLIEKGIVFPGTVAKLGIDTFAYVEQWLGRLEAELEEALPRDRGHGVS